MLHITLVNENVQLASFNADVKKLNIIIADKVKQELNNLLDEGTNHLILDLNGISFIDSSGFGSLVTVFNHAKNLNAQFHLCGVSKETMELLRVTKLDQVFSIGKSVDDIVSGL